MKVNLLADLESYKQYDNQNRGEKLYSELKSIADKMTKNEPLWRMKTIWFLRDTAHFNIT